ncbi:MAG: hypothetical protein GX089_00355 [Fibrobacter sp.]|nr:hypothetical protein [Fibrobacter sp.]HON09555.1 hypothetical protein [Chitinispirillaceae bacterium]
MTVRKIDFSIKYSFGSELIQNAYPALYAKPLCNASTYVISTKINIDSDTDTDPDS